MVDREITRHSNTLTSVEKKESGIMFQNLLIPKDHIFKYKVLMSDGKIGHILNIPSFSDHIPGFRYGSETENGNGNIERKAEVTYIT